MATNTTNLNLIKPSGTDKIRIAQINQNMDILDEKIGPVGSSSLQDQMSTVTGYTTMSNGMNLNTLTNKANYLVGNISQMLNAPTGAGTSGFFYVEKNSSYILQRFWGNLDKAYRFSYDNGSTWTSWIVHKTQIDSLNSQIGYIEDGTFNSASSLATLLNNALTNNNNKRKLLRFACNGSFDSFYTGVSYFVDLKCSSTSYSSCIMQGVGYDSLIVGTLSNGTWSFKEQIKNIQSGQVTEITLAANSQTEVTVTLPVSYSGGNNYIAVATLEYYATASNFSPVLIRDKLAGSFVCRIHNSGTAATGVKLNWMTRAL